LRNPLEALFEKLSLKISGIFNGAGFIIFTALMKHKRRILEKLARHSSYVRFGKPNGVRVVSLKK
jgi:hypothetical protein